MKRILYVLILIFFTSCSSINNVNLDKKVLLDKNIITYTANTCMNNSYITSKSDAVYGKLFIEYMDLDEKCEWNGFQRGYFERLFKKTLNIKSLKVVERFDYSNYEFTTYLIDEKYYINLIYNFDVWQDMFVLDYKGILSEELINKYNKGYKNKYMNKLRFNKNYSNSLVRTNIVNDYFEIEPRRFD